MIYCTFVRSIKNEDAKETNKQSKLIYIVSPTTTSKFTVSDCTVLFDVNEFLTDFFEVFPLCKPGIITDVNI